MVTVMMTRTKVKASINYETYPQCGGRGKIEIPVRDGNILRIALDICPYCRGLGEIPNGNNEDEDNGNIIDPL